MIRRLTVRLKIGLGYGVVVILLLAMGVASILILRSIRSSFDTYASYVAATEEAGRIEYSMANTQMVVTEFLSKQDAETASKVRTLAVETQSLIAEASASAKSEEQKTFLGNVDGLVETYVNSFSTVASLQGLIDQWRERMNNLGPQMEQKLGTITRSAFEEGDSSGYYYASQAMRDLLSAQLLSYQFLVNSSDETRAGAVAKMKSLKKALGNMAALLKTPEQQALAAEVSKLNDQYSLAFQEISTAVKRRNEVVDGSLRSIGPELSRTVEEFRTSVQVKQNEIGKETVQVVVEMTIVTAVVCVFALFVGVALSFFVGRAITRPIPEIFRAMKTVASGDMTTRAAILSNDEIGDMAKSLNGLIEGWRQGLQEVAEASSAIASAAEQLAASSSQMNSAAERMDGETSNADNAVEHVSDAIGDLSKVAVQLSANAGTVASAAEQLNASISEVSAHAIRSSEIAHTANQGTRTANVAITSALTDMAAAKDNVAALSRAAQDISEVIQVISAIADQTNLLALNATIEAARAGDAGKGFAVVANEVKNLATQSARAAEEITQKILATQDQVSCSVKAIEAVAESLEKVNTEMAAIGGVVEEIDAIASSIAQEVQQQGLSTAEISSNVEQVAEGARHVSSDAQQTQGDSDVMKRVVETITAISGETANQATQTAAAAGELGRLSQQLDTLVKRYKLHVG